MTAHHTDSVNTILTILQKFVFPAIIILDINITYFEKLQKQIQTMFLRSHHPRKQIHGKYGKVSIHEN